MAERRLKLVVNNGKPPIREIKHEVSRHRCPFYNFIFVKSKRAMGFVDFVNPEKKTGGCALTLTEPLPCIMEDAAKIVDWDNCSFNLRWGRSIEKSMACYNFFPAEFRPDDTESWSGLSYEEWKKYVIDPSLERPKAEKK